MKKLDKKVIIFSIALLFSFIWMPNVEKLLFNIFIENYMWNQYWFEFWAIWIASGIIPIFIFYKLNIDIERNRNDKLSSNINLKILLRLIVFIFFVSIILFLSLFLWMLGLKLDELEKFLIIPFPIIIIIFFISKFLINKILKISNEQISKKILWIIFIIFIFIAYIIGYESWAPIALWWGH